MEPQTFANHTRWHPPFHYFIVPVMLINFIVAIVQFARDPGWNSGWWIVFSLALVMLTLFVRVNPLRAQDRTILLEERLRYQQLLSRELAQQASALNPRQMIALRFASDSELEELVSAIVTGKLSKGPDIKRAIKNWRPDTFRV
jgi:hypothetical protein